MRKTIKTAKAASADESVEPTEVTETTEQTSGEPATGDAADTLGIKPSALGMVIANFSSAVPRRKFTLPSMMISLKARFCWRHCA